VYFLHNTQCCGCAVHPTCLGGAVFEYRPRNRVPWHVLWFSVTVLRWRLKLGLERFLPRRPQFIRRYITDAVDAASLNLWLWNAALPKLISKFRPNAVRPCSTSHLVTFSTSKRLTFTEPTVIRRTSGHRLWTFIAVNLSLLPPLNAVSYLPPPPPLSLLSFGLKVWSVEVGTGGHCHSQAVRYWSSCRNTERNIL
jgi:hypothetical protein